MPQEVEDVVAVIFCSVPGPLQFVQCAENWSVKLALQAAAAVHVGVANFNVVRQVVRLIEGFPPCQPFAPHNAGDLLLFVQGMFEKKGRV